MDNLPTEIKYRGMSYVIDKVEDGRVFWTCTYSRYKSSCSVEAWQAQNPYGDKDV